MCMLFSMCVHAQDSLPKKLQLKLFDAGLFAGFALSSTPTVNPAYIATTTRHTEYATGDFIKGYDDSIRKPRRLHGFGPAFSGHLGISASFQLANAESKLLKRLKPRFGIYHSYQKIYESEMSYLRHTTIDSIYPLNPASPAIAVDSASYGRIAYSFYRKSIYMETGANFDIIVKRRMIVYVGLLYGYGIGYSNTFRVSKYEHYTIDKKDRAYTEPNVTTDLRQKFSEPVNYASRITIPAGIQHRFAVKHRFSVSFFGEMRFGLEFDKLKYINASAGAFFAMNGGLRFSFRYHK